MNTLILLAASYNEFTLGKEADIMTQIIKDVLSDRIKLLSETIEKCESELKGFPDGRISIRFRKNRPYYYLTGNGLPDRYLGKKDVQTIEKLIQKGYINDVISSAKYEMELLKTVLRIYPDPLAEELYEKLSDEKKKDAEPIVLGNEAGVRDWLEKPYDRLGFRSDMPVYITIKGERVRSKSEMIIADRLFVNGIPYKYECPILIGKEIIHPDFTILRLSDKKLLYHEHCGMVDDPQYAENMVSRVNDYSKEGLYLGDRLFLSMETSKTPLDVRAIDNLIRTKYR